MKKQTKYGKLKKVVIIGWVSVFCLYAAFSGDSDNNSEKTKVVTVKENVKEEKKEEKKEEVVVEESTEEKATRIANKVFKEENINDIFYNKYDKILTINAKGKENLSSKLTVKAIFLSISEVLEALSDEGIKDIDVNLNVSLQFVDDYGNVKDYYVVKVGYTKETLSKINWDNFTFDNVLKVADSSWTHRAISDYID